MKRDYSVATQGWWYAGGLLCAVFVTYLIYRMGLPGSFLLDDFGSLAGISHVGNATDASGVLRYLFGNDGSSWSRSLSYLSFLVDDQVWPSYPRLFKTTNIALHLIIGLLGCLFLFRLLRYRYSIELALVVSVVATSLWLIHPLQVSTVLYVVQRMSQLSMLFVLLTLLCHCSALNSRNIFPFVSWVLLGAISGFLGVLSKENALTGIWLMALCSWFVGPALVQSSSMKRLRSWYIYAVYMGAAACFALFIWKGLEQNFGYRVFDQAERLAIQGFVLTKYLQYWIFPTGFGMGLFHDDMEYYLQGWGTVYAFWWGLHLTIIFMAWRVREKLPLLTFGIIFFYVAHIIESTIWPLELMYEHRNYLPSLGLSLATAVIIQHCIKYCRARGVPTLGYGLVAMVIGLIVIQLVHRVSVWSDYKIMISKWAYEHPYSLRAQTSMATMLSAAGMATMASDKLSETYERLPSLTVRLQQLNLQCDGALPAEEMVSLTKEEVLKAQFSSGVLHNIQEAVSKQRVECFEESFNGFNFDWLLTQIKSMEDLRSHSRYLTQLNDVASSYYISRLEYTPALKARLEMYERQPTIDTALKLTELFVLGGDTEGAKEYLDRARLKNHQRWYLDESRDAQIASLEKALNILLSQKDEKEVNLL